MSSPNKKRTWLKRLLWTISVILILMNAVAAMHAYHFTHFAASDVTKSPDPLNLTRTQKLGALLFGVGNPRPQNDAIPSVAFETILLKGEKEIQCWHIRTNDSKGTVALFHGFASNKSKMLDKAEVFRQLGYNVLLVDFMGSGGSEGDQTTIGYHEAEQVKTAFDYLKSIGEDNIVLFGTSMGAVAIMKAINDYSISPKSTILECPFGSMYETVCARFKLMNVPTFPMAGLLVFWGGIENGFWAFGHNPTTYASSINCQTLLLAGGEDDKVSRKEIDQIYTSLSGPKSLHVYPNAGHENYLIKYKEEWTTDITAFLNESPSTK